jgi:8-oxo-dGTP pyrophosphatase MutT (NUDIX family)
MKISAFGAIFDDQGRILCVKRNYGDRTWTTPGGGIEHSESPFQAAQREAYEETGYRVEVEHLIGVYCSPWMDDYVLFFQFRVLGYDGWQPNAEIAEIGYFRQDALPQPMKGRTAARIYDAFDRIQGIVRVFSSDLE